METLELAFLACQIDATLGVIIYSTSHTSSGISYEIISSTACASKPAAFYLLSLALPLIHLQLDSTIWIVPLIGIR